MPRHAVVFDFNGTLSDDEAVLCEIFIHLFGEHGRPLSAQEYFDRLAGLSDPEIVRTWLGRDHPGVDAVVAERVERYRAAVSDGSTIHEHVREAVRWAAGRVPLAICSGAARAEIEPVVEAAGLAGCFRAIVSSDEVVHGKPRSGGLRDGARAARRPSGGGGGGRGHRGRGRVGAGGRGRARAGDQDGRSSRTASPRRTS